MPYIPPAEPCTDAPCEVPSAAETPTAPPAAISKGNQGVVAPEPQEDAGAPPMDATAKPLPGDGVVWMTWPEQQTVSSTTWGPILTDIVRHLPASYGTQYYDSDRITYGHETTHGIHAHLRNNFTPTGKKANAFYVLKNRAAIVIEPNITKAQVAAFVPTSLRESRYATYVTGQTAWNDTPLYLWDEWVAYTNGTEVGVDLAKAGMWNTGWRDGAMGAMELTIYALAVGMAVEKLDATYFAQYTQFREFLAWSSKRAMAAYREGAKQKDFAWDKQDAYYASIRSSADAKDLRQFVRRVYGGAWGQEVLGLDVSTE